MIGERVCQRTGLYADSWMDQHAGRLYDDHDLFIFVDDFERNRLGGHRGWSAVIERYINGVTGNEVITGALDASIYLTGARVYQRRDPHSAEASEARCEKLIQPLASVRMLDCKTKRMSH